MSEDEPYFIKVGDRTLMVKKKGTPVPPGARRIEPTDEEARSAIEEARRRTASPPASRAAPPTIDLDPADLPRHMRHKYQPAPRPTPQQMDERIRTFAAERALPQEQLPPAAPASPVAAPEPSAESESESEPESDHEEDKQPRWAAEERAEANEGVVSTAAPPLIEEEKPPTKTRKNLLLIDDFAKRFGTWSEAVERWVTEMTESLQGRGTVRVVISPSVFARDFFPPVGFSLAVYRRVSETCTITVPARVFDHARLYEGFYVLHIPRTPDFESFYAAADTEGLLPKVCAARDEDAQFGLRESFLGVFAQCGEGTGWKREFYLVVRDVDREASRELFQQIESKSDLVFPKMLEACDLERARQTSVAKRRATAASLYRRIAGAALPAEELVLPNETHTTTCGFHFLNYDEAWVYACGLSPVYEKQTHVLVSTHTAGLHLLCGPNSGKWSVEETFNRLMPCTTPLTADGDEPIEGRADAPDERQHHAARDAKWLEFEKVLGRDYMMVHRQIEPVAVAHSLFTGDDLENSEFADL